MPNILTGLVGLLLLLAGGVFGQNQVPTNTRDILQRGLFSPSAGYVVYGTDTQLPAIEGDIYIDTVWQEAAVWFYPEVLAAFDLPTHDSIAGWSVRINGYQQVVEFRNGGSVNHLQPASIQRIKTISGGDWINTRHYGTEVAQEYPGFVEVLADGQSLALLRYVQIVMQKPTYNPALDVGERNARLVKVARYYWYDHSTAKLAAARFARQPILAVMDSQSDAINKYAKDQGLDWKNPADIATLVHYYNRVSTQ